MILSVNYNHTSNQVHYIFIGPDGTIYLDSIVNKGSQTFSLPNMPAGNYTLFAMDPQDMTKFFQETVVVGPCITPNATPNVTPSITPSITPSPPAPGVSQSATPTPTATPTATQTPTPSPINTTYVTMTKYSQIASGGTIEIRSKNNTLLLSKSTTDLSIGANVFTITPYSGPYYVILNSIFTDTGSPAYVAVTSNTGIFQSSNFGSLSVSGYGQLVGTTSTLGITLGSPL